jgi:hypothetical protein
MLRQTGLLLMLILCLFRPLWSQMRYYRGNVHTHTTNSDGELSPMDAVNKYKNLGYDFCAITDHNKIIDTRPFENSGDFFVIGGEEYTAYYHVNALDLKTLIVPSDGYGDGINAIAKAGAIPILNHPTWPPVVPLSFVLQQSKLNLMEIYNYRVQEQEGFDNQFFWDQVLSAGKRVWGVAGDDAHYVSEYGRGWIMVYAYKKDRDLILSAIRRGQFYCSTGVWLDEISLKPKEIKIVSRNGQFIRFIGKNRTVLDSVASNSAVYNIKGSEGYIRVEISNKNKQMAWTQPLVYNDYTQPCVLYVSGDNQFQFGLKPLAKPLVVQIRDVLDRPLSGKKVVFQVTKGDLHFNNKPTIEVVTDANGFAQVTPTLGRTSGERQNIVMATVESAVNPVEFYSTVLTDNAIHLVTFSGDLQTGRANEWLGQPLLAMLLDQTGLPLANQVLQFAGSEGIRFKNGANAENVTTDSEGFAAVQARLNQKSGAAFVKVTLAGDNRVSSQFQLTTTATSPYALNLVSGDQQVTFSELYLEPFTVAVTDTFGNPIAFQPVEYSLQQGVGVFASNITTVLTNPQGQASVRYNIKSTAAVHRIEAASTWNGSPLRFSPVTFTAYYKTAGPDSLRILAGANQVGIIRQPLPSPFQLQVIDDKRKPVAGHRVVIKAMTKGAKIAGQDSIIAFTDAQGQYKAVATLGEAVGPNAQLFEIRAWRKDNKTPLFGAPAKIYASARRSAAMQIKALSPLQFGGSVGASLADSIRVLVTDATDKPVAAHPVRFRLESGRGQLNGKSDSLIVTTSSSGRAAVQLLVGKKAGTFTLTVSSDDGISPFASSPILFKITAKPGAPDRTTSTLSATPQTVADGKTAALVTLTVKDAFDNPLPDITTALQTFGLPVQIVSTSTQSDSQGKWLARLTSTKSGQAFVWTLYQGRSLPADTLAVSFTAGKPSSVKLTGTDQSAVRNRWLPNPAGVHITDAYGNAVTKLAVRFSLSQADGYVTSNQVSTDSTGMALVRWRLGPSLGEQKLFIEVDGWSAPLVLLAMSRPADATRLVKIRGDQQSAGRLAVLADSLIVAVQDSAGLPVSGQTIRFRAEGQGEIVGNDNVKSNGSGLVGVQIKSAQDVGSYGVWAFLGRIDSVRFTYSVISQTNLVRVGTTPVPALSRPGALVNIRFQIKDSAERPQANEAILYKIVSGNGYVLESMPLRSDAQGFVGLHWVVGAKGPQQLRTWAAKDTLSELKWNTTVYNTPPHFEMPDSLFLISGQAYQCPIRVSDADHDSIVLSAITMPPGARLDSAKKFLEWRPRTVQEKIWTLRCVATDTYGAQDTLVLYLSVQKGQSPAISSIVLIGEKQQAIHCTVLRDKVGITIVDRDDDPIPGVRVHFSPLPGFGSVSAVEVATDSSGTALTEWRLGEAIGEQKLSIQPLGWNSPIEIAATSLAAPAGKFMAVCGDQQTVFRNAILPDSLTVAVLDTCGHPLAGQVVLFEMDAGGEIIGRDAVLTNQQGMAFARVKAGKAVGRFAVHARIKNAESFSLPFEFRVQAKATLSSLNQRPLPGRVRPGSEIALRMQLRDVNEQPLAGSLVHFSILEGYGRIKEEEPVQSDETGAVSVNWIVGSAGAQSLRTWADMDTLSEIIWHTAIANSALCFAMPDTLYMRVGDEYRWPIKIENADPDSVTITADHLPNGARLDSSGRTLLWQPRPDQQSVWLVRLQATDLYGGVDSLALYLAVSKINRPPCATKQTPSDTLIFLASSRRLDFSVDARDPDLDSLRYRWYWNDREIQRKPELALYFNPTFPKENSIRLVLSDGELSEVFNWRVVLGATTVEAGSPAISVPDHWALAQNHPNPFNAVTSVAFDVPHSDRVTLKIYDIYGREAATLLQDAPVSAGTYHISWNATKCASGTFICVLQTPTVRLLRKMILLR